MGGGDERKRSFFEWGQRLFGNQERLASDELKLISCFHSTLAQKLRATVPVLIKVINCVLTFEMV
jgi:hypothetical protein